MAGKDNLQPFRSVEEARENGKKGGKASGESRRRRKALKDSMNALLDLPISNTKDFNKVAKMGVPVEDIDNSQIIVVALFNRAKSGNVMAIKELRNLIGEDDSNRDQGMWEELVRGMMDEV
jgi:hypothetical protein